MATLNINGVRVQVDDSFKSLTPEQQNATVEEIARSLPKVAQKPSSPTMSRGDAFVTGLGQGASVGLADESRALVEAGKPVFAQAGQQETDAERQARELFGNSPAMSGLEQMALGGRQLVQGDAATQGRYDQALAAERQQIKQAEQQYPWTTLAGNIVGGLAVPLPAAGSARSAIAAGAGMGAAYGFGTGEGIADRLTQAGVGGALGGAVAGAAPYVVKGVEKAAEGIRSLASPIVGAVNPEAEAARRIQQALQRDMEAGGVGLTRPEFAAAQQQGLPVVAADIGGETTRALARSAANTSPEGRAALDSVIGSRFEGQSQRISDLLGSLSPLGANATKTVDDLQAAARAANRPLYAKAYQEGSAGVWNETLAGLAQAPAVQEAIKEATKTGANRAVADGFKPVRNPFGVAEDGSVVLLGNATPTLQFWDHVKRNLDDMIESARRAGAENAARDFGDLKNALLNQLDAAAPTYAQARRGAAAAFGAEDAVEAGRKFINMRGNLNEAASAFAKLTDAEKDLFKVGFVQELQSKLANMSDRSTVLNKVFIDSPAARRQIELVFGKGGADKLEAQLRIEGIMDALRNAVGGNSTTARQLAEIGLGGGLGYVQGGSFEAVAIGAAMTRFAGQRIDKRVSQRVAEMLASPDPKQMQKAIQIVAKSPAMLDAMRKLEAGISRAATSGSASPAANAGASFLAGPVSSRADPQQEKQN